MSARYFQSCDIDNQKDDNLREAVLQVNVLGVRVLQLIAALLQSADTSKGINNLCVCQ